MFVPRLVSGIVLVILALGVVTLGGPVLLVCTALIALVGTFEVLRAFSLEKQLPGLWTYACLIMYYIALGLGESRFLSGLSVLFLSGLMTIYVFSFPKFKVTQIAETVLAFFYSGLLISCLYRLRELPSGRYLVWLVFLSAWGNDTLAYCTGMLAKKFGKTHQMSPELSPKKSVEGGIGGVVGAVLLGVIYAIFFGDKIKVHEVSPVLVCALTCFCGAFVSVIGDLAASAIKRNMNIKDYGNLIPGHGGIMDRFDSMILVAPAIFYVVLLVREVFAP